MQEKKVQKNGERKKKGLGKKKASPAAFFLFACSLFLPDEIDGDLDARDGTVLLVDDDPVSDHLASHLQLGDGHVGRGGRLRGAAGEHSHGVQSDDVVPAALGAGVLQQVGELLKNRERKRKEERRQKKKKAHKHARKERRVRRIPASF